MYFNIRLRGDIDMRGLAFFIIGVLIIFGVYKVTDNKAQQQKTKQAVESQLNEGMDEVGHGSQKAN